MKFADFKPWWTQIYRDRDKTPDNGGFPTGTAQLSFICPACGPPYSVTIKIGPKEDRKNWLWGADPMPDGPDWPDRVTITPSIDHTGSGHGLRHPTCAFHASITKGKIVT